MVNIRIAASRDEGLFLGLRFFIVDDNETFHGNHNIRNHKHTFRTLGHVLMAASSRVLGPVIDESQWGFRRRKGGVLVRGGRRRPAQAGDSQEGDR